MREEREENERRERERRMREERKTWTIIKFRDKLLDIRRVFHYPIPTFGD